MYKSTDRRTYGTFVVESGAFLCESHMNLGLTLRALSTYSPVSDVKFLVWSVSTGLQLYWYEHFITRRIQSTTCQATTWNLKLHNIPTCNVTDCLDVQLYACPCPTRSCGFFSFDSMVGVKDTGMTCKEYILYLASRESGLIKRRNISISCN